MKTMKPRPAALCRRRFLFHLLAFFLLLALPACDRCSPRPAPELLNAPVTVKVEDTLSRLLADEDTDGDTKITVDDRDLGGGRGDKEFFVQPGGRSVVRGAYPLACLLEELILAKEQGKKTETVLDPARIIESPLDHISRNIRERYWDGLTRRVDEQYLPQMLADPKLAAGDTARIIYVPGDDQRALGYFREVSARHRDWRLQVTALPAEITPDYVRSLNGRHGVLALGLVDKEGKVQGAPFVVPGGRFNEMYGWDSYFEALGLLADGRLDLARSMVDNFVYEIEHYGMILNANRSYYLLRSQPPFLTSMALAVYERTPRSDEDRAWLSRALAAAVQEYENVWMASPRLTERGLSRYAGAPIGPCPEVEPGHYDHVLNPYADAAGMSPAQYYAGLLTGALREPALDAYFRHDRAMRESGHDTSYRFDDRAEDFLPVDLNSLLYKYETDIARAIDEIFAGQWQMSKTRTETSAPWRERAEARKAKMNQLMAVPAGEPMAAVMFDYDLGKARRSDYIAATSFYPLWAGLATPEQAEATIRALLPRLEQPGGIAGSDESSRGPLSEDRPARQWDYPYGWPPHQILIWQGLRNYGHDAEANRLAYQWLYMIAKNAEDYNGTVPEKYDVVKRTHQVFAEYGNVGTKFSYITREGFGWMNASYELGLQSLPPELLAKLKAMTPPEKVFGARP
jgi:alpha,alpha-trehalase